jgi:hypothetical protein
MPSTESVIDGARFSNLAEAASEFTRALNFPKPWTGDLDLFDDLLRTGGDQGKQKVVVWRNSKSSRERLNYDETIRWYERHLLTCDTVAFSSFEERLANAQQSQGPTVFDWLVEIIRDHEHIDLRLE